jgi:hypothetical protein
MKPTGSDRDVVAVIQPRGTTTDNIEAGNIEPSRGYCDCLWLPPDCRLYNKNLIYPIDNDESLTVT